MSEQLMNRLKFELEVIGPDYHIHMPQVESGRNEGGFRESVPHIGYGKTTYQAVMCALRSAREMFPEKAERDWVTLWAHEEVLTLDDIYCDNTSGQLDGMRAVIRIRRV